LGLSRREQTRNHDKSLDEHSSAHRRTGPGTPCHTHCCLGSKTLDKRLDNHMTSRAHLAVVRRV